MPCGLLSSFPWQECGLLPLSLRRSALPSHSVDLSTSGRLRVRVPNTPASLALWLLGGPVQLG